MVKFDLQANYSPMGDQIEAVDYLAKNIENGVAEQVLLGATATGKTFTIFIYPREIILILCIP